MRKLVLAISAAEAATGAAALAAPSLVARLLLGAELAGAGGTMCRFAGIALIALGVACWPPPSDGPSRAAVRGLFVYGALVAVGLAAAGVFGPSRGPLLWPAAVLHLALTILLARAFFAHGSPSTSRGEAQ